jgi:TatD DNase family protein
MTNKKKVPEPKPNLKFIDVHCHLPFPRSKKSEKLPPNEQQYNNFFEMGGVYLITSTVDLNTLNMTLDFIDKHPNKYGFTCGWAPQTVTYTPENKYEENWRKWVEYITQNQEEYLAIGEIGLDFHHAKTLEKRKKQIAELKKIINLTKDFDKPYILHVRNAAEHEFDRDHPKHRFNNEDGATKEVLRIIDEFNIDHERVMFHCFSGPKPYGRSLPEKGITLSVPSSAYGFKGWRENTKYSPLDSLVTETDSYYQHPYKHGPYNVPANVRYSIAAIAYTHDVSQEEVSTQTIRNAIDFFDLDTKSPE